MVLASVKKKPSCISGLFIIRISGVFINRIGIRPAIYVTLTPCTCRRGPVLPAEGGGRDLLPALHAGHYSGER